MKMKGGVGQIGRSQFNGEDVIVHPAALEKILHGSRPQLSQPQVLMVTAPRSQKVIKRLNPNRIQRFSRVKRKAQGKPAVADTVKNRPGQLSDRIR
jgi:hypothetical protein